MYYEIIIIPYLNNDKYSYIFSINDIPMDLNTHIKRINLNSITPFSISYPKCAYAFFNNMNKSYYEYPKDTIKIMNLLKSNGYIIDKRTYFNKENSYIIYK